MLLYKFHKLIYYFQDQNRKVQKLVLLFILLLLSLLFLSGLTSLFSAIGRIPLCFLQSRNPSINSYSGLFHIFVTTWSVFLSLQARVFPTHEIPLPHSSEALLPQRRRLPSFHCQRTVGICHYQFSTACSFLFIFSILAMPWLVNITYLDAFLYQY